MLIETRWKTGRVEGALVFAKAPSSLVPKSWTKFFGNEGSVPFIRLGDSIWVSWFPKDQVATLYLFSQTKQISKGFQKSKSWKPLKISEKQNNEKGKPAVDLTKPRVHNLATLLGRLFSKNIQRFDL